MDIRSKSAVVLLAVAGAITPLTVNAAVYRLTELTGTVEGERSVARGINDAGHIVGAVTIAGMPQAVLWQNGTMTDLGSQDPLDKPSLASNINNAGQVVGYLRGPRPFLWQNNTITALGAFPGGFPEGFGSSAVGINDAGQVLVVSAGERGTRTFLWQNCSVIEVGTPALLGQTSTTAAAINDAGQVVGRRILEDATTGAYLWQNGTMTELGNLPGAASTYPTAINDYGQVAGYSYSVAGASSAFLWQNGTMNDLGINLPGATSIYPSAINDAGLVVGYSYSPVGPSRAFLWQAGKGIEELNKLIDPSDPLASLFSLEYAYGINTAGQIVGEGTLNGASRAFLATPVPAPVPLPGAVVLIGPAIGTLLMMRRRAS